MRTTVDLPSGLHAKVTALAKMNHTSVSATLAGLVARGMEGLPGNSEVAINPRTGLPNVYLGAAVTVEDIADLIEDDI